MIRGLVIGKFMPVHKGHVALIRFAAEQCDELILSMSYRPDDPIPGDLRLSWLREIFSADVKIRLNMIPDNFDDEAQSWPERTNIWAAVIRRTYPPIDILFSSEEYGSFFANSLGVRNVDFDPSRKRVPVSASMIRGNPMRFWKFIPDVVRPFYVKRVCFYGPESTGKSRMAERMAEKYNTEYVPEVAREFLINNNFTQDDIIRIGKAHLERIETLTRTANRILFVDTDAITTKIYCQYYLGSYPSVLDQLERCVRYAHYFLFDIDVPWVPDGLRDLGHKRPQMFSNLRRISTGGLFPTQS
jgi:HTH-type transcriptional repressor of NAD biosynthesis genes